MNFFILGFKEQIYDVYRYLPPDTQVTECVSSIHVHVCACMCDSVSFV